MASAPGTGKTESALQIARQTGRDLYVVDASKTKSMWFATFCIVT
jgi:DNA helicase TIP49 (TBP-interacting protein)